MLPRCSPSCANRPWPMSPPRARNASAPSVEIRDGRQDHAEGGKSFPGRSNCGAAGHAAEDMTAAQHRIGEIKRRRHAVIGKAQIGRVAQQRMIHVIAPDQVMLVAGPGGVHLVRQQQQARGFDTAQRRDIGAACDREVAMGAAHRNPADAFARLAGMAGGGGQQLQRIGIEQDMDIPGCFQWLAIGLAEAGGRAALDDRGAQQIGVQRKGRNRTAAALAVPERQVVEFHRAQLAQRRRLPVIRIERGAGDGPAAVRPVRPLLEPAPAGGTSPPNDWWCRRNSAAGSHRWVRSPGRR